MAKIVKKIKQKSIDLNIREKFKLIDEYLPQNYTPEVLKIVPTAKVDTIRSVRKRKRGNIEIIKALYEVALKTKQTLN